MTNPINKKILFITPPYHAGVVEVAGRWIPLYLVYLAGVAREAGYEPIIYDAMTKFVGHEEIEAKIREVAPAIVATSSITCTIPDAIELLETAKRVNPEIMTLLGGVHPTFMYDEIFATTDAVDYIVRGEGEHTLDEFLRTVDQSGDISKVRGLAYRAGGETVKTADRPMMDAAALEALPKAWEAVEWEDYKYFIIPGSKLGAVDTSRGCDKDCTFCSQRKFWDHSWRARSPESVVADIEEQMRYGVDVVLLTDDYPTKDRERWERILDIIIEKELAVYLLMETRVEDIIRDKDILHKYRKAGIIHIYVGTERTDQETIDLLKKDIKVAEAKKAFKLLDRAGIITETSMILGLPHDTEATIEKTLKLAIKFNPDFCHFLAISPWPYADMYDDLKGAIEVTDYKRYNLIDPIIKPDNMTLDDIDRAIVDSYRRFYMNKLKILKKTKDRFKREYILEAMRRIMTSSFIVDKIGDIGEMPEEVKRDMETLKTEGEKTSLCPVKFFFNKSA